MGEKALTFADAFKRDGALSLSVAYDTEASGEPFVTEDTETILAVFTVLENMTVVSDEGSGHTDDDLVYFFVMKDGSYMVFRFQMGHFMTDRMDLLGVTGFDELLAVFPPQSAEFFAQGWLLGN